MKVLELAGGPAAGFAGMVLASLGADVIRVEGPDGHGFERNPTAPVDPDTAVYLHRRKRRIELDITRRAGARAFVELAASADAIVEDLGPGAMSALDLSYRRLRKSQPGLVVVAISPFGEVGSRANWDASELTLQALGGILHSTGFEREPGLRIYGTPAHYSAGIQAATAVYAGVLGVRLGTERGVRIEVSMEESFMHHYARHIQQWGYSGHGMQREERGNGRQGFPHTVMAKDGWLYVLALNADWEPFAVFLGLEEFATMPWNEAHTQIADWDTVAPHYFASLASKSRYQWFADAAERGYTFAPIHDVFDVVKSEQAAARGAFETLAATPHDVPTPRLPFAFTMSPPAENRLAAPGEHTGQVFAETKATSGR